MQQPPAGLQPTTTVPGPPAGTPVATGVAPTNTLAVVSLVASCASFFIAPVIGAVIGVICGHLARGQIRETGEGGGGLATAGLIIGYIHLGLVVLGIVVAVVLLIVFGAAFFYASRQ